MTGEAPLWRWFPEGTQRRLPLRRILGRYGLALEDAWVFGDSMNDLSMFQYARNAVLMGRHDKESGALRVLYNEDSGGGWNRLRHGEVRINLIRPALEEETYRKGGIPA